ncbi:MAG: arsenate reductase (glutaredoxin) [Polyangiaceae bacterium]|nr:arsenate reductase (glutaredoxin) [Myxococcales bacterium]MCB9588184.1 arsenate reductase (glutaredoxin) [Polyangiaceae bacterium]
MSKQSVTLWHNPRCSKSREALQLLSDRLGADAIQVREYLKQAPSKAVVEALLKALSAGDADFKPHDVLRSKEPGYKKLGLSKTASKAQIVAALVKDPSILERPVLVVDDKARIGRPPERVLELLES